MKKLACHLRLKVPVVPSAGHIATALLRRIGMNLQNLARAGEGGLSHKQRAMRAESQNPKDQTQMHPPGHCLLDMQPLRDGTVEQEKTLQTLVALTMQKLRRISLDRQTQTMVRQVKAPQKRKAPKAAQLLLQVRNQRLIKCRKMEARVKNGRRSHREELAIAPGARVELEQLEQAEQETALPTLVLPLILLQHLRRLTSLQR
mmetsp:Transcript_20728/g.25606  ORF Transcript_20728/g.25606 Transcript_20728/m.25606 type:complete len:203 (+) Transcript_20728:242-850(+)